MASKPPKLPRQVETFLVSILAVRSSRNKQISTPPQLHITKVSASPVWFRLHIVPIMSFRNHMHVFRFHLYNFRNDITHSQSFFFRDLIGWFRIHIVWFRIHIAEFQNPVCGIHPNHPFFSTPLPCFQPLFAQSTIHHCRFCVHPPLTLLLPYLLPCWAGMVQAWVDHFVTPITLP